MPDVLSGDGSGLDSSMTSPDAGASLYPTGSRFIPSGTQTDIIDLGRVQTAVKFRVTGMDILTANVYCMTGSYPASTLTIERSIDGITWTATGSTITATGEDQIDGTSEFITGSNWVRFRVSTAAGASENLARITITTLRNNN